MNLINLSKRLSLICATGVISFACTKTEDNMGDEAACELYLKGLSYKCVDNTCNYIATLDNASGTGTFELEVNQATYEHYKAVAEQKEANVCWEGEIE